MAGSVLMLLAILSLAYLHKEAGGGSYSFDLLQLYEFRYSTAAAFWFFAAFAAGVRHQGCRCFLSTPGCRTRTSRRRPPVRLILAGVLLKMGTYG